MEITVSKLIYYCNRSINLYTRAISMTEKANLRDIFRSLKKRRLKLLLQLLRREPVDNKAVTLPVQKINNLSDLLNEIKLNEEHLIEYSTKIVKNNRVKSSKVKEFIKSSISEIKSSIHWLDVITAHYSNTRVLI